MSGEGPKLFTNKPKKSKLKESTPITTTASASSTGAAATPPPRPPPPPPQPPKESFVRRYRFLWPLLLVVNFTIGAYVLMRTTTKKTSTSEEEIPAGPATSTSTSTVASSSIIEKPIALPIIAPVVRAPVPKDQQHKLFEWMLEEKRKVIPRDAEEKSESMRRNTF